jgi:hypothetical protein
MIVASNVYANGNAIACKAGDGKVVAAFPDVCLSPPPPPGTPVPVPYACSSFSKDMMEGSQTVKIGGEAAMLKDQSYYATSPLGDEAATEDCGGSVVTHTLIGKTYFIAWSMDVKFEGLNVGRHLDLTTSNHASYPGSTPPNPNMAKVAEHRARVRRCPCCGKRGCVAAVKRSERGQLQTLEEFYGLNAKVDGVPTPQAAARSQIYEMMKKMKAQACTCKGRVFPSAPCDVFRPRVTQRTKDITAAWGDEGTMERYAKLYRMNNKADIEWFFAHNPKPKSWNETGKFEKVNHLTPKSAGGCPTAPGNLQPDGLLCKNCKKIDAEFGKWQSPTTTTKQEDVDAWLALTKYLT